MRTLITMQITMQIAALKTAEAAIREEPYPRLPALAGTLAMAAYRMEQLEAELRSVDAERQVNYDAACLAEAENERLRAENEALRLRRTETVDPSGEV